MKLLVVAALAVLGCGDASDNVPVQRTLAVSAAYGLTSFQPGPSPAGSTAQAMDLVYEPLAGNARIVRHDDRRVLLERLPESRFDTATLRASLDFQGLVKSSVNSDGLIVAEFESLTSARGFRQAAMRIFALGPFRVATEKRGFVRLERRVAGTGAALDIVEVRQGEQWKGLLGHQLDVVPSLANLYRHRFGDATSIRIIDFPVRSHTALVFNTRDAKLASATVRRRISRGLDTGAIARLACGTAACAVPSLALTVAATGGLARALPTQLGLLVLNSHAPSVLAAKVVKHQLRRLGIDVKVEAVTIAELRRVVSGRYELAIVPVPKSGKLVEFTSKMVGSLNLSGYSNAEFDAAFGRGDLAAAQRSIDRDVPVLRLFEMRQFAAVDAKYCGGHGATAVSWKWIADLHLCADGER